MLSGITAGSVAAIIAVLVSLPLRSPSDTLLNSASVALAALLAGVVAGLLWLAMGRFDRRTVYFLAVWTVLFVPVGHCGGAFWAVATGSFCGFCGAAGGNSLRGNRGADRGHSPLPSSFKVVAGGNCGSRGPGHWHRAGQPDGPGKRSAGTAAPGFLGSSRRFVNQG